MGKTKVMIEAEGSCHGLLWLEGGNTQCKSMHMQGTMWVTQHDKNSTVGFWWLVFSFKENGLR